MPEAISKLAVSISSDGRDDPPDVFAGKFQAGEAGGAARIWVANHLFQRDPVTRAAQALGATKRLGAGLMAVNPFTSHPVQLAMAASTLDELFPGRVTLCLGSGSPVDLDSIRIAHDKPLKPMRETLEVTRALLAGEKVRFEGETFSVLDRSLATGNRAVPIYVAASRPRMLAVAAAHADGILVSGGSSVEFVRWCREHAERGAAGKPIRMSGLLYAAVDPEPAVRTRLKRLLGMLLRNHHHRTNIEAAGTPVDQAELRAAIARGDWASAEAQITDDVLRKLVAIGTAEEVRAKLADYQAAGLSEVVFAATRDAEQIASLLRAVRA